MATYVVRIYRAEPGRPPRLVGIVEQAGGEGRHRFHDADEMVEAMAVLEGIAGVEADLRRRAPDDD